MNNSADGARKVFSKIKFKACAKAALGVIALCYGIRGIANGCYEAGVADMGTHAVNTVEKHIENQKDSETKEES